MPKYTTDEELAMRLSNLVIDATDDQCNDPHRLRAMGVLMTVAALLGSEDVFSQHALLILSRVARGISEEAQERALGSEGSR